MKDKIRNILSSENFPYILGAMIAAGGYASAVTVSSPARRRLEKQIAEKLDVIPVIDPEQSSVKVRPGIMFPLTRKVELDLKDSPSTSVLSKTKSMYGYGTADFTVSANPFDKKVEIDSIYLRDKYQGKGIGKGFTELVQQIAKETKKKKIHVIADEGGKYYWSRVPGMVVDKDQRKELLNQYKKWAKKNKKPILQINNVKDYPKEFLLSDDAGNVMGFIGMYKKAGVKKIMNQFATRGLKIIS